MKKFKSILENQKAQNFAIIIAVVALFITVFSVWPFATDGYEDISSRDALNQRIAMAITNHQDTVMIDYSGEDWENLKSWLKDDFRYPILSQYTDEFSIYNYENAKFTYWTYGTKKRVKIVISYKMSVDEINAVNNYADEIINSNGLRNMSQYDAVKFVHDYLINNFKYNVNENSIYTMIQNGQTNCYGYTIMNYIILNRLGIEVRTTYGTMNNSHIWNTVRLDGQWYYEDITWDTVNKGTDYFLISTSKLQLSHTILGNFIPDCPSDYVANTTIPDNTGNNTDIGDNETTDNITDNDTVTDIDKEEETETETETDTDESIKPEENNPNNSFQDEIIVNPTPNPVESAVPKTEKIQKLSKLLKALKTLKNK